MLKVHCNDHKLFLIELCRRGRTRNKILFQPVGATTHTTRISMDFNAPSLLAPFSGLKMRLDLRVLQIAACVLALLGYLKLAVNCHNFSLLYL